MNDEIRSSAWLYTHSTARAGQIERARRRIGGFARVSVITGVAAIAMLSIAATGCHGASSETDDAVASDPRLRAERIEELRQAIERDHVSLEDLITRPDAAGATPLYADPELREIAARLGDQERSLELLKKVAETAKAAEATR